MALCVYLTPVHIFNIFYVIHEIFAVVTYYFAMISALQIRIERDRASVLNCAKPFNSEIFKGSERARAKRTPAKEFRASSKQVIDPERHLVTGLCRALTSFFASLHCSCVVSAAVLTYARAPLDQATFLGCTFNECHRKTDVKIRRM